MRKAAVGRVETRRLPLAVGHDGTRTLEIGEQDRHVVHVEAAPGGDGVRVVRTDSAASTTKCKAPSVSSTVATLPCRAGAERCRRRSETRMRSTG